MICRNSAKNKLYLNSPLPRRPRPKHHLSPFPRSCSCASQRHCARGSVLLAHDRVHLLLGMEVSTHPINRICRGAAERCTSIGERQETQKNSRSHASTHLDKDNAGFTITTWLSASSLKAVNWTFHGTSFSANTRLVTSLKGKT